MASTSGGGVADGSPTISEIGGSFILPGNDSLGMGKCGDERAAARRGGEVTKFCQNSYSGLYHQRRVYTQWQKRICFLVPSVDIV